MDRFEITDRLVQFPVADQPALFEPIQDWMDRVLVDIGQLSFLDGPVRLVPVVRRESDDPFGAYLSLCRVTRFELVGTDRQTMLNG